MNKSKIFILLIILVLSCAQRLFAADVSYSISNDAIYSMYSDSKLDSLVERMDLNLSINQLRIGILMDARQPLPNSTHLDKKIGPVYLRKRFVEISKSDVTLRVGNFPIIFGRGLALNLFRDDGLPHDNEADGVKLNYQGKFGEATIFSANVPKFNLPAFGIGFEVMENKSHIFRGGLVNISGKSLFANNAVLNKLKLGGYYVRFRANELENPNKLLQYRRQLWGGMLNLNHNYLDGYFEAVVGERIALEQDPFSGQSTVEIDKSDDIRGFYSSLIGYIGDVTLSVDWKDYREMNFTDSDQRMYSNPPIIRYQHASRLLGRHLYQENLFDETGYKLEATFSPDYSKSVLVNFTQLKERESKDELFKEVFLNGEYDLSEKINVQALLDYSKSAAKGKWTGGYINFRYLIGNTKSLTLFQEIATSSDKDITEHYTTLSYAPGAKLNVSLSFEGTNEEGAVERTEHWFTKSLDVDGWLALDVSLRLKDNHLLRIFMGERREGLNCNGAICTLQPAFSGFELQLISVF